MANKNLLILDWSNLLFRSLFMNQLYGKTSNYDRIEDMRSFIYKFATDVCSILNIFKPSNVIIATDAQHAWRKDVLPGEMGYKSNRQKNENYNWDNIFKCSDDLKSILEKHSLHVAQVEHCEADDIVALCKEVVFEKYHNYNIIIVSADADLRQLIDFNNMTNQYCAVYNTTSKGKTGKRYMYVTQEFLDWYNKPEECDIFFSNIDTNKQYIKDILNTNQLIELSVDNPNEVVLSKIFCGDDGDCVPSFYDWYVNGKFTRITPAKAKKIRKTVGINNVQDLIDGESQIKPILEKICKKEVNDIDIHERLMRQRTLVELNSSLFPTNIRDYKDTIDYMIQDIPDYGFWNIKAAGLLEGTEYEGANKKRALEADVFKDMSKYINTGITQLFV